MRRTLKEDLSYYGAIEVLPNIYVGTKNIVTGYRIITVSNGGYTSIIVRHDDFNAIVAFNNRS